MNNIFTIRATAGLFSAAIVATSLIGLIPVADAQQAYTAHRTSLRSGPNHGYPQVGWVNRGAPVYVNGCVRGYHWCDVSADGNRGWVNARHLSYLYQNRAVAVYGNGATYGFPVVGFALGSYWDNHYRGQAWYGNRPYWNSWRPGSAHPRGYAHGYAPNYSHGYPRADIQPSRPAYEVAPVPHQHRAMQPQYVPRAVQQPRQNEVRQQQQPRPRIERNERSMGSASVGSIPRQ
jgi:uncharacterized protein YraI